LADLISPIPTTYIQPTTSIPSLITGIPEPFTKMALNDSNNVTIAEAKGPTATSISSQIAAILSEMQKNEQNADIHKESGSAL
jgi:hypothetical protein